MHFSYVEIGDNFIPDIATDPYRRVPVKFGITLNPGESLEEAKEAIKQAIKEYIHENKIESPHIVERYLSEQPQPPEPSVLPSIQVEKDGRKSIEEEINGCLSITELEGWYFVCKNNDKLKSIYDIKKKQLVAKESKEIIDKTNALCSTKT